MRFVLKLLLFVAVAAAASWLIVPRVWQPGMARYLHNQAPPARPSPSGVTLTWMGVSSLLVRDGEHALMIDPFFTRPAGLWGLLSNQAIAPDHKAIERGLAQLGVTRLDAVLVSHSHFDHAMDAGVVARISDADLIGSPSTLNIGRGAGLPGERLKQASPEQPMHYGPFTLRWVRSQHAGATGGRPTGDITAPLTPPAGYMDYRQGGTWSILIEHQDGTLLHHGSAGFEPGALEPYQADIAILGVALVDDYGRYFDQVINATGARVIIPVHWDDFTRPLNKPLRPFPLIVRLDRFFNAVDYRADLEAVTLPLGQATQAPWPASPALN